MNRPNWLTNILGFILLIIVLILLAAPYFLVIYFPNSGSHIAEISKFFIPWAITLLLFLVFNEQIKLVVINIGDLIRRVNKGGIGPVTWDARQDTEGLHLTKEQTEQLRESISKMEQEKNQLFQALRYYFHRTLYLTIYRSQIELLLFLENLQTPIEQERLRVFYEAAINRNPALKQYPFEKYLEYLKSNFLILVEAEQRISITPAGRDFLTVLKQTNVPMSSFPN